MGYRGNLDYFFFFVWKTLIFFGGDLDYLSFFFFFFFWKTLIICFFCFFWKTLIFGVGGGTLIICLFFYFFGKPWLIVLFFFFGKPLFLGGENLDYLLFFFGGGTLIIFFFLNLVLFGGWGEPWLFVFVFFWKTMIFNQGSSWTLIIFFGGGKNLNFFSFLNLIFCNEIWSPNQISLFVFSSSYLRLILWNLNSSISPTESDVNIHACKAWTVIDRLTTRWKSDLSEKIKWECFQAVSVLLYDSTS